ncbi:multi protein bridging factor 1 [Linderina pennispora]|uniref:Multi protein bridging factor 1 n=1 Tax=Linderina pennispora TaxID=61395 RepID=A0A1Y1W6U6_9FUNG|nr:multi protein bridging factor 1 [Linderina pennispora]ORX69270.1 multi protein bridging factor 1 [Linderina pennispora]
MSDWDETTVLRKSGPRPTVAKSQSVVNAARRAGELVSTERKSDVANRGHHVDTDHRRIAALDRSDDVRPPSTVNLSVGKAIQQARQAKGWTQKDLATRINEKPTVVNEYEATKALRGKDIGGPLHPPKKK